jgi:ubiquinone/menaquinone biosynthesis C-methylase UbiE
VVGDAEKLPLPDNSVDAYTIAFGVSFKKSILKFCVILSQ